VITPLLMLGVLPGIIGFVQNISGLTLWAIFNILACTNDIIVFWESRRYLPLSVLRIRQ
jgi:hypothetical protein